MKHKFSLISALLAGVMFIAIGCSNASNITFTDGNNGNFTENGMSLLTVNLSDFSNSRTILPENWDEGKKEKLIFVLSGKGNKDSGKTFTSKDIKYAEIKNNDFSVEVEPINWNFTLTAYQVTQDANKDEFKQVMSATATKDMTKGSAVVDFILAPLSGEALKTSQGVGDVLIDVSFTQEADALVKTIELDIFDSEGAPIQRGGDKAGGLVKVTKTLDDGASTYVAGAKITTTLDEHYIAGSVEQKEKGIKAGDYTFKAIFKDNNDNVMAQYISSLRVDGGNLSKASITMPAKVFNSVPVAPVDLTATTYFAPGETAIEIEKDKVYAQSSASSVVGSSSYNIKFTWKDSSYNEEKFELRYGSDFIVSFDGQKAVINKGSSTNNTTGVAIADLNGGLDGDGNGTMGPDCNSITLKVPMGKFLDKSQISIYAVNSFGDSKAGNTDKLPAAEQLGMFVVEYNLQLPDKATTATVTVKTIPQNQQYYIEAFNYGEKKPLLTSNTKMGAYVSSDKYKFGGWYVGSVDGAEKNKVTETNSGTETTKITNTNTQVIGNWNTDATIKLTYPGYSEFKNINSSDQGVDATKIDGNVGSITFTLPSTITGTVKNTNFEIINPKAESIYSTAKNSQQATAAHVTATTAGAKTDNLIWNITDYLGTKPTTPYGVYSVYISYTVDGVPISGIYYVEILNTATKI